MKEKRNDAAERPNRIDDTILAQLRPRPLAQAIHSQSATPTRLKKIANATPTATAASRVVPENSVPCSASDRSASSRIWSIRKNVDSRLTRDSRAPARMRSTAVRIDAGGSAGTGGAPYDAPGCP